MFLDWLKGDGPIEEKMESFLVKLFKKNTLLGTVRLGFAHRSLQISLEPDPEQKMSQDILLYLTIPYFVDKLLYALPAEGTIGLMESINHKVAEWDHPVAPTPEAIGADETLYLSGFDLELRRSKQGYPYLDVPGIRRDPMLDNVTLHYPNAEFPKQMTAEAASYYLGLHMLDYASRQLPKEFSVILKEWLSHQRTFFLVEGANVDKITHIGRIPNRILMTIFDGKIPHYAP